MSELKPCPFCGSAEVELAAGDDVGLSLKITCGHCMGSGPRNFKTQGAHANWNHRPLEDHLRARVKELEEKLRESEFEYCEECNNPLSPCGETNPDGTPSMDCKPCHLRARVRELEDLAMSYCAARLKSDMEFLKSKGPSSAVEYADSLNEEHAAFKALEKALSQGGPR